MTYCLSQQPLIQGVCMSWQERTLDTDVVDEVCSLKGLEGATPEKVAMAVQRRNRRTAFRVAYELLLDQKKAKMRKEGEKYESLIFYRIYDNAFL